MANVKKLGQFGHSFVRRMAIVKTVEQRSHDNPESTKLWKRLTLFVAFPTIVLGMVNSYIRHEKSHGQRPEYKEYPHLKIMNKPFPWGDGKHSFFHNPKTNYVPGVGYEE
ncbi:cytochrome c oxidase subunit 6A1, mitochondrial [Calliopsis andreniformis]|uniref:cytochrome c oxidase subunit 6A1, mitochondrial n=1 Tax=Calliopsis andreniformis TaxID=337506 RepID=UPI003FCC2F73